MGSPDPTARSAGRAVPLDLVQFLAVLDRRDRAMRRCEAFLDDFDASLMPVMPDAAFIRQAQTDPLCVDGISSRVPPTNFLANMTGQPSVVLPCGFSSEGLPIGLQLTGRRWGDARLLGVAKALEKLLPPCPLPPGCRERAVTRS